MDGLASLWGWLFSWPVLIVLCATLGLAPFFPEPHIVEKLRMLASGDLRRPVDLFDLALHGAPWLLLAAKGILTLVGQ